MKKFIFRTSSFGLLAKLIGAHVFGTLFAYIVYIRFTNLGDGYRPQDYEEFFENHGESFTSTLLTFSVYNS